jgi:class 3 adenylate cyclase
MSTLPVGTVTLLFSDIEGSTRLLQNLGVRYEALLTDHRRLLRSRFEENAGVVVDSQGDAFLVVFRRAQDAVIAAVEAQRALVAHDWSASARPQVRMAIHTGEPEQVGDAFIGISVHRAARICSAGHGGQILLSATTRDLAEENLPSGVALIDLGTHRLKDFDRPESISQLVIEGIPPVFTPLKRIEDQPADTSFTGGEAELARAAEDVIAALPHEKLGTRHRWMTTAKARALDWRQFLHVPGHSRVANRLEGLGFSIHSTARIAPREIAIELRSLGRALVTMGRDARTANRLLDSESPTVLARQLAHHRKSAYLEHHLQFADKMAKQIAALQHLADARRNFERETRGLEPRVRSIRAKVFDARLDTAALDQLATEIRSLQEAAEGLAAEFHEACDAAASAFAAPRTWADGVMG